MRLSYRSNIATILTLGLASLALLHCSSNHLGTPSGSDASAEGGDKTGGSDQTGDSDEGNDSQEECATPCGPDLRYGCFSESTCSASTVCHYTCPNEIDVSCTGYNRTTPSTNDLCADAGLDAGSDGCRNYLASCTSR